MRLWSTDACDKENRRENRQTHDDTRGTTVSTDLCTFIPRECWGKREKNVEKQQKIGTKINHGS